VVLDLLSNAAFMGTYGDGLTTPKFPNDNARITDTWVTTKTTILFGFAMDI
jgi:hypothetical protein